MARLRVAACIVSMVILLAQGCVPLLGGGPLSAGATAPPLTVQFRGEPLTVEEQTGRIVLVSFWSST